MRRRTGLYAQEVRGRRSEAGGGGVGVVLVLAVVAARVAERVWGRNNPGAGYIYIYIYIYRVTRKKVGKSKLL